MFWVISVYFNIRNTLPKSGTFLLGHPVYHWILLRLINLSQKKKLQRNSKKNTSYVQQLPPLPFENRIVYEIMWENEPCWPHMAIRGKRIVCWITKATNARSEYVCSTYYFTTVTVVTRTRLSVTLHVCALPVLFTMLQSINNCPTRCNTKQSIYYSASALYMFRVSSTPIMSTQNCNYSLRYCSYFLRSYCPPTWPTWPRWREVAAQYRRL